MCVFNWKMEKRERIRRMAEKGGKEEKGTEGERRGSTGKKT